MVADFQSDADGRRALARLSRTPESHVSEMINALCDRYITLRTSRLTLLRALWICSSLRTPITLAFAKRKYFRASPNEDANQLTSFTQDEHTTAILLEELSYLMALDARNTSTPVDQRLRALSTRSTALVQLMRDTPSTATDAIGLLVTCTKAIVQIGSSASMRVYERLLTHILLHLQRHQVQVHVSQLSVILHSELAFTPAQHFILGSIVENFVSKPLPPKLVVPFLRALVSNVVAQTCSNSYSNRLMYVILFVLRDSSDAILSDCVAVIEHFLHESSRSLFSHFVCAFSSLVRNSKPLSVGNAVLRVTSAHVTLLFALVNASREHNMRNIFISCLNTIMASPVSFDVSLLPSSASMGPPSPQFIRKAVITSCLQHSVTQVRSDVVLQYFQSLLWRSRLTAAASDALFEAFTLIPSCRVSLLRTMFVALFEKHTPSSVLDAYATLLEAFASSCRVAFALTECKDIFSEGLQQLLHVPPVVATRVVPAFVSIVLNIPSLVDPILVFLRKLVASRAHTHQRTACAGFVAVLEHNRATPNVVADACDNLAVLVNISRMSVRNSAIARLLRTISVHNLSLDRIRPLVQHVITFLHPLQNFTSTGTTETVPDCFVNEIQLDLNAMIVEKDGEFVVRHPVALLLRFCILVQSQFAEARKLLEIYYTYLGRWDGGLLDAVTRSRGDAPIDLRLSLLCSLLKEVCMFPQDIADLTLDSTTRHFQIYGTALIIRDSLKTKEGMAKALTSFEGITETSGPDSLTAREGVASRIESEHFKDLGGVETIPLGIWTKFLQSVNSAGNSGVLMQTVLSEIFDKVRSELETCSELSTANDRPNWCNSLLENLSRTFSQSSPWAYNLEPKQGSEVTQNEGVESDARASSCSTIVTSKKSQSSSESTPSSHDQEGNEDDDFLRELKLENEEVAKLLRPNRIPKLVNAARMSIRESCLKILHLLIGNGVVGVIWEYVIGLCEGCLSKSGSVPTLKCFTADDSPSFNVEDNCHGAMQAVTRMFRKEFSHGMTVNLTSLYLGLMDVLLEKLPANVGNSGAAKKEVYSTILDILREFSVQHIALLRQMIKVLLKALDIEESIRFGKHLLQWLGNHSALVDSQYCKADDIQDVSVGVMEFDRDIFEDAVRMDYDVLSDGDGGDDGPSLAISQLNGESIVKDKERGSDDLGPESCLGNEDGNMSVMRSLCLNETAEGAVASICCVFTLFTDVSMNVTKILKSNYNEQDLGSQCAVAHVQEIAKGFSVFIGGEFVESCLGCREVKEDASNGSLAITSNGKKIASKRKRRKRSLEWPVDLEKKFSGVVFALMDALDILLRTISKELGNESTLSSQNVSDMGLSCTAIVRVLYEETNTLEVMGYMGEDSGLRWSVQERVEYAAMLFEKRWHAWKSKRKRIEPNSTPRSNAMRSDLNADNVINNLAQLVVRLLCDRGDNSTSKSNIQTGWWKQPRKKARPANADANGDANIGDDHKDIGLNFVRERKRNRIRSRNNYIDKVILEDREYESFADLEDFVVDMGVNIT